MDVALHQRGMMMMFYLSRDSTCTYTSLNSPEQCFGTEHSSPMATETTRCYTSHEFEILLHVTQTITSKFITHFAFGKVF